MDAKWRGEEEAFLINIFPRPPPRWCVLCVFRKGLKRKRERERERGKVDAAVRYTGRRHGRAMSLVADWCISHPRLAMREREV